MKKIFASLLLVVCLISSYIPEINLQTPTPIVPTVATMLVPTDTQLPIAGDLGFGKIHGKITDAVSGAPIAGALITCEHHSYTSPATCSGTVTTDIDGVYIFENVFFHDTDTIKLIVEASGYQAQEITQTFFTMPDMEANVSLIHTP